jgi:hypothetical protein
MKTRTLVIGAVTFTALAAGGWALAQSVGPQGGFGPPFMHDGKGHGGMGPGMMKGMDGMGPGMMQGMDRHGSGMGKGMRPMHGRGAAFPDPETDSPKAPSRGTVE